MQTNGALALVTGAGQRIGRAVAIALADAGADVIIHCNTSRSAAEATASACREFGAIAQVIPADLSTTEGVTNLWESTLRQTGASPSIIVNNASYYKRETFAQSTATSWDTAMAVNLRAPFILTQLMAHELTQTDTRGCVINMNDRRQHYRTRWTYGVTVGGLSALTAALAEAVAPNIRVNELRLGPVMPPSDAGVETMRIPSLSQPEAQPEGSPPLVPLKKVTDAVLALIRDDDASGQSIELTP